MLNLSDSEYRKVELESYSSLKNLLTSPQEFLRQKVKPFEGSDSTLLGSAVHHYLQGNRHLVSYNPFTRQGAKNKEAHQAFIDETMAIAPEDTVILPKSWEPKLEGIMASYNENTKAQKILSNMLFEVPFVTIVMGHKVKGRLDGLNGDSIGEIKTCYDVHDPHHFKAKFEYNHYDMQAALYQELCGGRPNHWFIVINTKTFQIYTWKASKDTLDKGRAKLERVFRDYKKYIINGEPMEPEEDVEL